MKNLFYSAADKIGQKPDSILYRLPTWHPIYFMPFGQSENLIYTPVRAESFGPPLSAGQKKESLVRICRAIAGGKRMVEVLTTAVFIWGFYEKEKGSFYCFHR